MPDEPDDQNNGGEGKPEGMPEQQHSVTKRKMKVVHSQSAQEVKFADMFGFTITPTHGIIKFGVMHPETGEFVVHTQVAMTPVGLVSLSGALQNNIQKVRSMKNKPGPKMN